MIEYPMLYKGERTEIVIPQDLCQLVVGYDDEGDHPVVVLCTDDDVYSMLPVEHTTIVHLMWFIEGEFLMKYTCHKHTGIYTLDGKQIQKVGVRWDHGEIVIEISFVSRSLLL